MSTGWLLPFVTLTSGSELWRQINHNPTSQAEVVALVDYFIAVLKRGYTSSFAAADGVTLWRFAYPLYRNSPNNNPWKQATWLAQNFSRVGFEIEVCYDQFYADVSVAGDRV